MTFSERLILFVCTPFVDDMYTRLICLCINVFDGFYMYENYAWMHWKWLCYYLHVYCVVRKRKKKKKKKGSVQMTGLLLTYSGVGERTLTNIIISYYTAVIMFSRRTNNMFDMMKKKTLLLWYNNFYFRAHLFGTVFLKIITGWHAVTGNIKILIRVCARTRAWRVRVLVCVFDNQTVKMTESKRTRVLDREGRS